MIRKALQALRNRTGAVFAFWLVSGILHIAGGMFLGAVVTSMAGASPLDGSSWGADWSKIATLLVGLVGVYIALERRLTTLETSGTLQREKHAAELKLWVQDELRAMRDTLTGHTHRIDAVERHQDRP